MPEYSIIYLKYAAICLICYVAGSIPTAYIIGKLIKKIDIRQHGSGNVGATNAFRVLGKKWGIVTLILDMLKGFIPVYLITIYLLSFTERPGDEKNFVRLLSGLMIVIGHIYTMFLGFTGGKGVAAAAGFLLALTPVEMGLTITVFIMVLLKTKMVSLSSIISALTYPLFLIIWKEPRIIIIFATAISLLIIIKHRTNIQRIIAGAENKIKF